MLGTLEMVQASIWFGMWTLGGGCDGYQNVTEFL